jgi:hypothetical protein
VPTIPDSTTKTDSNILRTHGESYLSLTVDPSTDYEYHREKPLSEESRKKMNRAQRAWIAAGSVLLIAASLFPPFRYGVRFGYGFLFHAPFGGATVDLSRLLVEWALIIFATVGLAVGFRGSNPTTATSSLGGLRLFRSRPRYIISILVFSLCAPAVAYFAAKKFVTSLPSSEVAKVTGTARLTNYGSMELYAYNGSTYIVTDIRVSISVFDLKGNTVIPNRVYRLFPRYDHLTPMASDRFSADVGFTLDEGQYWEFTIVGARGRPE